MTTEAHLPSAWYAARRRGLAQWWTVLHPPYTLWHLSYVVLGAALAPSLDVERLLATVLAFALAVGLAAHVFDELTGRPLGTTLPSAALGAVGVAALAGAIVLGLLGMQRIGAGLAPFIVAGAFVVVAYNLELLGGVLHNAPCFAVAWGVFPVLTAYFAQTGRLAVAPVLAGVAAFGLSLAQRSLSAPARRLRRHVVRASGALTLDDGTTEPLDQGVLLAPLETSLRILSWTAVALAAAVAASHLGT